MPFLYIGLADMIGRKFAVVVGGVVFFIGGAVQAGTIALWYVYTEITYSSGWFDPDREHVPTTAYPFVQDGYSRQGDSWDWCGVRNFIFGTVPCNVQATRTIYFSTYTSNQCTYLPVTPFVLQVFHTEGFNCFLSITSFVMICIIYV